MMPRPICLWLLCHGPSSLVFQLALGGMMPVWLNRSVTATI